MLYFQPDTLPKLSGKPDFDHRTLFQVISKHMQPIQENLKTIKYLTHI